MRQAVGLAVGLVLAAFASRLTPEHWRHIGWWLWGFSVLMLLLVPLIGDRVVCVIDSPGIREFGLGHVSRQTIEEGFIEFRPLLGHCRFRDCKHDREPGCALLAALADGRIQEQRMHSYRHIIASLPQDSY